MKGSRALGVLLFVTIIVAIVAVVRVSSAQQPVSEETISGTISATRVITQNARLRGDVTCMVQAAPCIQFGAPGLTLNLSGFTMTGQGDPSTGCQGQATGGEVGVLVNGQTDETIQGPGLVQRFRNAGIFLTNNSSRIRVTQVTVSTNCLSGILVDPASDSLIEENVSVRNGNMTPRTQKIT